MSQIYFLFQNIESGVNKMENESVEVNKTC